MKERILAGKVALVAGGTRGAGRGIAISLGEVGATVYVTGRSTRASRSEMNRTETIEDTVDLIHKNGGKAFAIKTDHTDSDQVRELIQKIDLEQGRLDILVNDIWGGDPYIRWEERFWEHSLENGIKVQRTCLESHLITNYFAAPLMIRNRSGLILEITDGIDYRYRGNLYYTLIKSSIINLSRCISEELKPYGITALSLTPGFLRSEAMLDHFGVGEENWRDATKKDPHFIVSETPAYIGRAVAALAADKNVFSKTGTSTSTWKLSEEYDFTDLDGSRPHWGNYFKEKFGEEL
ncbi:SDR family oxidoreductase [Leptospira stimsonii]|uniref:SDR family NAD(P)-dependent oxidoreductase n=1 Tax=Leptospira stimsonii TaxID=2202203 RepID=A0A4R9L8H7_9LEPT|nr:SDR family oxidoreductase [Leptospira stimsonii]RHX88680.1 short-chain dehydrogenase [Leptospira stimsonii]TGK22836.1 SDR family NAD(P)-dependent oxidoreductase [Leptospira stimsonii]TGM15008.1 SDR family NAD(P)-dependent oxidoreductase [Leptospira stimsonii]